MNTPHVLLVEDSNFMATKVVETLESAHEFVITTVSTADEARNALKNGSYDCIISNYELPDESGVELAESLEADPEIPSVPLIILTGRAIEPLARDAVLDRIGLATLRAAQCARHDLTVVTIVD